MQSRAPAARNVDTHHATTQVDSARSTTGNVEFADNRSAALVQRKLHEMINGSVGIQRQKTLISAMNESPRMVAQKQKAVESFGGTLQRIGEPRETSSPRDPLSPLQRTAFNDEGVMQEKSASDGPQKLSPTPVASPNKSGLPDQLKAGIESLSGMSMDHVKVHYNSAQPAQLNAHAYAQGNQIHVGPGQEQHLPHEAWHVVQQMQGRVRATAQAKGMGINDDPGLEQEATTMGRRALQLRTEVASTPGRRTNTSTGSTVQLARYLKCIQNPANMAHEVGRLTAASPLDAGTFGGNKPPPPQDTGTPIDLNGWLAGAAGISTTHYNPGQNQYYSPVGFIVDVTPARVLGNFAGDGSTSTLHTGRTHYWQAVEAIRLAMLADVLVNGDINANGYTGAFAIPVTNLPTATTLKTVIEAFLANVAVGAGAKAAAVVLIKAEAVTALQGHYQGPAVTAPLGPGAPGVLAALEANLQGLAPGASYHHPVQNRDIKYTESQVHAELAHVESAFYTVEVGDYPALINAAWRAGDPNFLNNRAQAAQNFQQAFVAAGNAGVVVNHLVGGQLVPGLYPVPRPAPSGFYKWALLTLGVGLLAVLYGPELYKLYDQYIAGNNANDQ